MEAAGGEEGKIRTGGGEGLMEISDRPSDSGESVVRRSRAAKKVLLPEET